MTAYELAVELEPAIGRAANIIAEAIRRAAPARIAELEDEVRGLRAFKNDVDAALNSGSGVYKP